MLRIVGKIVNTKGLKGEVKVLSASDFKEERFSKGNELMINTEPKTSVHIEDWRSQKGVDVLKFKEFNNINQVEKFKNKDLLAEPISESDLGENEYFFEDLKGIEVYENDMLIGKVSDVFDIANKTYLKIHKSTGEEKLLPYIDEFIIDIIPNEKMSLKSIPGLLDD